MDLAARLGTALLTSLALSLLLTCTVSKHMPPDTTAGVVGVLIAVLVVIAITFIWAIYPEFERYRAGKRVLYTAMWVLAGTVGWGMVTWVISMFVSLMCGHMS